MDKFSNRLVAAILIAWFCFASALGVNGSFQSASAPVGALTLWGLAALVLLVCWKIPILHDWASTVGLRTLIAIHLVRFIGIYFLILSARDRLPAGFARPAGIGDIIVATGAVVFLVGPKSRSLSAPSRIWNFFGFIDIVFVALTALRFGLQDWPSMAALRELPLSLLPTFFVPLIIASHVLIFVRLMSPVKIEAASP